MDNERIFFETPPDIEAMIVQIVQIRDIRKQLDAKEMYLKKKVKNIAADIGCDVFVAERNGLMVPIAYLNYAPPKIDTDKLKFEYEEIYKQCLIKPGIADRYLYTTTKALLSKTK